jgi:predicted HTH transcriptional regulator
MSEYMSDYELLAELKKYHPVATTPMLAQNMNKNPDKISKQLSDLQSQGRVKKLSLKGHVGWYVVRNDKIPYKHP